MSGFKTIYEEVKENYAFFLIIFAYFVLSRDFVNIYVHNSVKYSIYVIMVFTATYSLLMLFYFLCCYLFHWYQVATVENIISDKYEENSEGDITRKKVTLSVRRSDGFCIELTEDWAPFVDACKRETAKIDWLSLQKKW